MRAFAKWIPPAWLLGVVMAATCFAKGIQTNRAGVPTAAPEAAVDTVAYMYQKQAVAQLKQLIAQRRGAMGEADLLFRLVQLQVQHAETAFRIAHAEAYYAKKPIDLTAGQALVRESMATLDRLYTEFPSYSERGSVLILRARAFEDLGQKAKAQEFYEKAEREFPNHPQMDSVMFTLSEMKADQGDPQGALKYLLRLENKTSMDRGYLYQRIAYTNVSLKRYDQVFPYLKRYIQHMVKEKGLETMLPVLEGNYSEIAQFYFDASQVQPQHYPLASADEFFIDAIGWLRVDPTPTPLTDAERELFGKMAFRYAKILRTQGQGQALVAWKDRWIASHAEVDHTLEIWVTAFEDLMNKFQYGRVMALLADLPKIQLAQGPRYDAELPRKLLMRTADQFQKMFTVGLTASKGVLDAKGDATAGTLLGLYEAYLKMAAPNDPKIVQIQLNMAEVWMVRKMPLKALVHFEWVVAHQPRGTQRDVVTRVLAIRYDDLVARKVIPQELKPKPLDSKATPLPELANYWIGLVLRESAEAAKEKTPPKPEWLARMEHYAYDIERMRYAYGDVAKAVEGLQAFLQRAPKSTFALGAGQLVLDTYIASQRWELVTEWGMKLRTMPAFAAPAEQKRLLTVAGNAYYKQAETKSKAGDHAGVLAMSKTFYDHFAQTERRLDWLNMLGRAAMELKQEKQARVFLDAIVREGGQSAYAVSALAVKAAMQEKEQDLLGAVRDYRRYLQIQSQAANSNPRTLDPYRKKVLYLSWVIGTDRDAEVALSDNLVCQGPLVKDCDRIRALRQLQGKDQARGLATLSPQDRAKDANLVVMDVLTQLRGITVSTPIQKQMTWVQTLVNQWNQMDPLFQFSLIPEINQRVPVVFKNIRALLPAMVKIKADQAIIAKRVQWIQTVEKTAVAAADLPLLRVRTLVLYEVGNMYFDLAREIYWIPGPKGLSAEDKKVYQATLLQVATPFKDLGTQLQKQALDLAQQGWVEDDAIQEMTPKVAAPPVPQAQAPHLEPIDLAQMARVVPDWAKIKPVVDDPIPQAFIYWSQAVRAKRLHQMAYHLQELSAAPPQALAMARAISFATAGARAEAVHELKAAGLM